MVVRFAAERSPQLDGQWGDVEVEETLVWPVGRSAWPEGGGKKLDATAVGFLNVRCVEVLEAIAAMREGLEDFEGSSFGDGELGDAVRGGGALDFDLSGDDVARFVGDEFPGGVDTVGGGETAVFSKVAQDLCGEP